MSAVLRPLVSAAMVSLGLVACVSGGTIDPEGPGSGEDGYGGDGGGVATDTGLGTGTGSGTGTGVGTDTGVGTGTGSGTGTGTGTGSGTGTGTQCTNTNVIVDGGFESGPGGGWTEASSNFGTPLCDGSCTQNPDLGPNAGTFWAWFGGAGLDATTFPEVSSVTQSITIPAGATTLDFQLAIPACDGFGFDIFEVSIDGQVVFATDDLDPLCDLPDYQPVSVSVAAFANGGTHTLELSGENNVIVGPTSFFVDDVVLMGCI